MNEWQVHKGVTVVECPVCAFCFDADHTDKDGGYSCPVCAEIKLTQERHWWQKRVFIAEHALFQIRAAMNRYTEKLKGMHNAEG